MSMDICSARVRRGSAAALVLALLGACASRAEPLTLPAGHPADPATPGTAVADRVAPRASPPAPAVPAPMPAESATYACPMHPEVTSQSPGTCPKCGMALQPVKGADAPVHQHEAPR